VTCAALAATLSPRQRRQGKRHAYAYFRLICATQAASRLPSASGAGAPISASRVPSFTLCLYLSFLYFFGIPGGRRTNCRSTEPAGRFGGHGRLCVWRGAGVGLAGVASALARPCGACVDDRRMSQRLCCLVTPESRRQATLGADPALPAGGSTAACCEPLRRAACIWPLAFLVACAATAPLPAAAPLPCCLGAPCCMAPVSHLRRLHAPTLSTYTCHAVHGTRSAANTLLRPFLLDTALPCWLPRCGKGTEGRLAFWLPRVDDSCGGLCDAGAFTPPFRPLPVPA